MINTLAAATCDALGYVQLDVLPDSRYQPTARRVSRTRTLDGSAVIHDGGYAEADRVIELTWAPADEIEHLAVQRLVELYTRLVVSTAAGVFLAAPEQYTPGADESRLRLLVQSKLSA